MVRVFSIVAGFRQWTAIRVFLELLTPGNTTVNVTVGAIRDAGNNGTALSMTFIGYNSSGTTAQVLQTLYDSFTTISSYINTIRTDLTADQTAGFRPQHAHYCVGKQGQYLDF
jgi:hypothetical protein